MLMAVKSRRGGRSILAKKIGGPCQMSGCGQDGKLHKFKVPAVGIGARNCDIILCGECWEMFLCS